MDCFNTTFADSIECLGRRLETAISVAHLLIMYGSLVSAVRSTSRPIGVRLNALSPQYIIFAFFVQIRRMRRRRHYMGIPRTEMRIGEEHLSRVSGARGCAGCALPFTRRRTSQRAHRGCIKGISKSLDQLRVLGPPMSVAGDPGWEPSPGLSLLVLSPHRRSFPPILAAVAAVDRFGKRNYDADVARSLSELGTPKHRDGRSPPSPLTPAAERTAIGRDPALARRPDQVRCRVRPPIIPWRTAPHPTPPHPHPPALQDAAQYVAMLRTALPTVPDGLFQQYLQNYEAARYSENAVVGPQFQSFVQALEELHAGIAGAPLVAGLTSREGWASAMSPG